MNNWKYKIDVKNKQVFGEIEKQYNVQFSEELKLFIVDHNASTPEKYHFMVGEKERVFGSVLSVNKGEMDIDSIYTALDVVDNKRFIPFAIDSFGNYICYAANDGTIMYWDHESQNYVSTELKLTEFIDSLY